MDAFKAEEPRGCYLQTWRGEESQRQAQGYEMQITPEHKYAPRTADTNTHRGLVQRGGRGQSFRLWRSYFHSPAFEGLT